MLLVLGLGAYGHDHLADVDAGHRPLRLPEGSTHPGLEPGEHRGQDGGQDGPRAEVGVATGTHLSAPAQDNILLMRMTWKGCRRMRMWKPSLPHVFTMYLLAQIRAASRAVETVAQSSPRQPPRTFSRRCRAFWDILSRSIRRQRPGPALVPSPGQQPVTELQCSTLKPPRVGDRSPGTRAGLRQGGQV